MFIILLNKTRVKNVDLQHCFQVPFSWRHSLNSIEFSLRSKVLDITGNSFIHHSLIVTITVPTCFMNNLWRIQ